MDSLELIKSSLVNNNNLNGEIKSKIFDLVTLLHKKLPDVNLSRLSEKLKSVKIGKIGKFEKKGTYYYDVFKNEILFSNDIESNYDIDNLLMKGILQMATCTKTFTGFNSDERLRALNLAYTEILATFLVGNDGDSDLDEEMLITNILSHIVGKDTMYNSYFTNDGEPIIRAMEDAEVGLI